MDNSLTLPTPPATTDDTGDPRFSGARRHYAATQAGAAVFLGASVALGAEIAQLRAKIQPKRGGDTTHKGNPPSKGNTVAFAPTAPFRQLVADQSGVTYETARRTEKLAQDLLQKLASSRAKDATRARKLLTHPDQIQTYDDYALLAGVVGAHYDADTWTGLLIEAGIIRRPVAPATGPKTLPDGTDPDKPSPVAPADEARVVMRAYLDQLRAPTIHRKQWTDRLALLPLEPTGDPDTPSLTDLRAALLDQLTDVDQTIARKSQS